MEENKTDKYPEIKELFIALIERYKAGSPTQEGVYRISLKPYSIARLFEVEYHIKISNGMVKGLLKELGYGYRTHIKQLATGSYGMRTNQGYISIGGSSVTADFILDNLLVMVGIRG